MATEPFINTSVRSHQSDIWRNTGKHSVGTLQLKPGQKISYSHSNDDYEATVLGRAGKATGKHRNEFNLQFSSPLNLEGQQTAINLEHVDNLAMIDSPCRQTTTVSSTAATDEVLQTSHLKFQSSRKKELKSWIDNDVYEEVPISNVHQKVISTRWVDTIKEDNAGNLSPKSRLVARGFEDPSTDVQKESPTCSKDSLRLMMSIICQKEWFLRSIDVKTAFLQGETLERNVFLKPPSEANCRPGYVWKLKKCVYGLGDASLKWYDRVRTVMLSNGCKVSSLDPALFLWHKDGKLLGIIAVHVDDFLWSGTKYFEKTVISKLRDIFLIGKEDMKTFKYLGLDIVHTKTGDIEVFQDKYTDAIKPIPVNTLRKKDKDSLIPASEKEVTVVPVLGQ